MDAPTFGRMLETKVTDRAEQLRLQEEIPVGGEESEPSIQVVMFESGVPETSRVNPGEVFLVFSCYTVCGRLSNRDSVRRWRGSPVSDNVMLVLVVDQLLVVVCAHYEAC